MLDVDATARPRALALSEPFKLACSTCGLRHLCLPKGLSRPDVDRLETIVVARRLVARNAALFNTGDVFEAIYVVRTGFFKTLFAVDGGRAQVTGFHMTGELLGLDGIFSSRHVSQAIALEDSQVCVVAYPKLQALSRAMGGLQHQLHRLMSREMVRDHNVLLLRGSMRAEERVAAFLLNLMRRLRARGFSSSSVVLRMKRDEIGSHLGLSLETVSRTLSRLQEAGVLTVKVREVRVLKARLLHRIVRGVDWR